MGVVKSEGSGSIACNLLLLGLFLLIPIFLYVFLGLEPVRKARKVCEDQHQVYFGYLLEGRYEYVICNNGTPPETKLVIYEILSMSELDEHNKPRRVMAGNE
jgi:hypothetical protein